MIGRITKVRKRDGRIVDFDESKIADAIYKAACAVGGDDRFLAEELAGVVTLFLEKQYAGRVPQIEEIQDMVEKVLIETGHARTAKAYILYRDRRARAREQLQVKVEGHGEAGAGPVVGNAQKAVRTPWNKRKIAEALCREADLDEKVASEVAARVEEKVFRSQVTRIATGTIRSLVEAELFLMGFGDRVGRQSLVGLPRYDADRMIRSQKGEGWRPDGPRDLKRAVADSVLAQYALSEVFSTEVVDAHLEAKIHIYDVGCPFEWAAAAARAGGAADAESFVEGAALATGRLGELVTRELALLGLVSPGCAWAAGARGGAAADAARRLLGHFALRALDRRGGRFRLGFVLPGVPEEEASALLVEALVREHWARFRSGSLDLLPELILQVPVARAGTDAARRILLTALAAGAETGRVRILFERDAAPALVAPWFRTLEPELAEGALPVGGAVALNLNALAAGARGEPGLLEALEAGVALAAKALRQKRSFLASLSADPSGPLYRVAAGARPILSGGKGLDLLVLEGLSAAAAALGGDPEAQARARGRLRSYLALRAGEEGRKVRLRVAVAPERDGEAARRFGLPPQGDLEPASVPEGILLDQVEARMEPLLGTLEFVYPRDAAPGPEALFDAVRRVADDPRVSGFRLLPWPDRALRSPPSER